MYIDDDLLSPLFCMGKCRSNKLFIISVEDHFAKALGDTWLKLKAKEKAEQQQQKKKPQVAAV